MTLPSTLFRFRIDVSDVDRNHYEALDFRVAQHPSETKGFLLTRVLAYALNAQDGLEFSPGGLSDPEQPALQVTDGPHSVRLWIEIGNPSAKKVHRAAKIAREVRIYTYKDPDLLVEDLATNKIYGADRVKIFSFSGNFLDRLEATLERDNSWSILFSDGTLSVTVGDFSESAELGTHSLPTVKK